MTKTIKALCVLLGLVCVLQTVITPSSDTASAKPEEIKGVWVATVFSMDYPTSASTDPKVLKNQADLTVENAKKLGYNAIFLQVRPAADAFYKSDIYPWSKYLTGTEGLAPRDGFDPLEYIVQKAHAEGIALHAWINPYRVTASESDNALQSADSIAARYPSLVVKHSDGKLYLNPGEPDSIKLVVDGALEIVKGYEVDGIHIDDYFYPSAGFPDSEAFTKYGGSFSDIGDWRRSNTKALISELKSAIKAENADCLLSVSPCGIWANKKSNPNGSDTAGKQAYYDYYADTRQWVKEELLDIIIPQVYWNIGYSAADFKEVASWWNDTVDGTSVRLCIGQGVYKAADEADTASTWYGEVGTRELQSQLQYLSTLKNVSGYVHYRLGSALKTDSMSEFITALNNGTLPVFKDTEAYPWAREAIERLYREGIVNGMGDGTFGCAKTVTRADFAVMLVRLSKQNVPFVSNFSDVTEDKYYYNEVGIARVLGYISGRDNNTFDPTGSITREDMALIAYRVLSKQGKITGGDPQRLYSEFTDAAAISEYAREAVAAMTENDLLSGYETGEFKPGGYATRAETAVFLNRIYN